MVLGSQNALTPLLSCAAIGSTDVGTPQNIARTQLLKTTLHWPRQRPTRRYKIARHLPRFYARIQVQFLFLPRTCFLLFHALYSSPNFLPCCHTLLFLFLLVSFRLFTMGGKRSGYHALLFLIVFFLRRSNSELRFRDVHETLFIFSHILRCRAFIDDALFSRRTRTLV